MFIRAVLAIALIVRRVDALRAYLGETPNSFNCDFSYGYKACTGWKSFYKSFLESGCSDINFVTKTKRNAKAFSKYWEKHGRSLPCIKEVPGLVADLEVAKAAVEVKKSTDFSYDQYVCYEHGAGWFDKGFSWINTSSEDFAYHYCYTIQQLLQNDEELRATI